MLRIFGTFWLFEHMGSDWVAFVSRASIVSRDFRVSRVGWLPTKNKSVTEVLQGCNRMSCVFSRVSRVSRVTRVSRVGWLPAENRERDSTAAAIRAYVTSRHPKIAFSGLVKT
jgi:hypothetical protein